MRRAKRAAVSVLRMFNPLPEDVALVAELLTTQQRLTARLESRVMHVERLLAGGTAPGIGLSPNLSHLVGSNLERLTNTSAEFLNWASGQAGYSAQAGLWFNPPIAIEYRAGTVVAREMNEQVVKVPYAMAAAAELPIGSTVVDVGATESTLAISLASLGYKVTAIAPRRYPFAHPRLQAVTSSVETWFPEGGSVDAVFCISTIDHILVGTHGRSEAERDADRRMMGLFRKWLRPGGMLVLAVPYERSPVSAFRRTYGVTDLEALLQGWVLRDRRICARTSELVWEVMDDEPPLDVPAVALVKATLA